MKIILFVFLKIVDSFLGGKLYKLLKIMVEMTLVGNIKDNYA